MIARTTLVSDFPDLPPRPKHWVGTSGAFDVETPCFLEALVAIGETIAEHGVTALHGEPGLGKSFAALSVADQLSIPYRYLEAQRVAGKAIETLLLRALREPHDPTARRNQLLDSVARGFCREDLVLAIDECDRFGHEGMETIRYAVSQPGNKTTVILIGYKLDRLFARNPALDSRIARRVEFRPLDGEDALATLRSYHPIFEKATERHLSWIASFSGGEFRRMAQILKGILDLTDGDVKVRLTDKILTEIFEKSGRPGAR